MVWRSNVSGLPHYPHNLTSPFCLNSSGEGIWEIHTHFTSNEFYVRNTDEDNRALIGSIFVCSLERYCPSSKPEPLSNRRFRFLMTS
ncbi:hypothetical protein CDAR_268901 [Caerostris darwini]|uniref:Uncharacterized protein n=1 Tax=Caerostris darwini TaxID=1538125 RepID=A0AAV4V4Z6_9ARAC|nr:hypothetical protein CDAR_268901 [Caerostris darwini]